MPRSRLQSPAAKRRLNPKKSSAAKPPEQPTLCRPAGRTLAEFGRLSAAEKLLVNCCRRGEWAIVSDDRPEKGTAANRVRASLIRFLALGGDEGAPVHEYGVILNGAWISGTLSLEDAVLRSTLALQKCRIQKINAFRATIPILVLAGSRLEKGMDAGDLRSAFGLWMHGATCAGPVILRSARLDEFSALETKFEVPDKAKISLDLSFAVIEGCAILNQATANATVALDYSIIKGDLECVGAKFQSKKGFALQCDGVDVGHNIYLRNEFRAEGGVRMLGAKVGLTLDCSKAHFEGTSDRALECERVQVSGPVFMSGSRFIASVSFHTASIAGALKAERAHFEFANGVALDCTSASIGYVELTDKFSLKGQANFIGADVKGKFQLSTVRLENPGRIALSLDDVSVGLSVIIDGETHVSGAMMMRGAKIGRDLRCQKATFDEPLADCAKLLSVPTDNLGSENVSISRGSVAGSIILGPDFRSAGLVELAGASVTGSVQCVGRFSSFSARRASISADVHLARGFKASGEVNLAGATIGGNLDCDDGHFLCNATALDCENAHVAGNASLSNGFRAAGAVDMNSASIGKSLKCVGCEFHEGGKLALSLASATIAGSLILKSVKRLRGEIDLTSTRAGVLDDDLESWSGANKRLLLDGFSYGRISGPTEAEGRIQWLDHQWNDPNKEEFFPQPWEQLMTALRASGHPIYAREVAIARNDRFRRAGKVVLGARTLHRLYGMLVGYGYEPVRLLIAIIAVWLACAAVYDGAANPRKDLDPILVSTPKEGKAEEASSFDPLFYSADVLLPIVDLGYSETWKPVVESKVEKTRFWGRALRILRWVEIILGWLFGGALAAMLTQLVKKD